MTEPKNRDVQPYDEEVQQPGPKRKGERLFSLLIVGTLLLNFPLLSIFSSKRLVCGFPVLFLYIFLIWGLIIGTIVFVLRNRPVSTSGPAEPRKDEDH